MKIKKQVIKKIQENHYLKALLTAACGCTIWTIDRWLDPHYKPRRKGIPSPLTSAAALKVIREELGLTDDQILEETKNKVA